MLALSAFFGCSVVEDFVPMLGFEPPGGFFLLKYIFATAIGIAVHACLRRPGADVTDTRQA